MQGESFSNLRSGRPRANLTAGGGSHFMTPENGCKVSGARPVDCGKLTTCGDEAAARLPSTWDMPIHSIFYTNLVLQK